RRRHTRWPRDWSSDVCSSDLDLSRRSNYRAAAVVLRVCSSMVQLQVLSGKQAGAVAVARRFPFVIGRNGSANLRLEEEGIWHRHLEIDLRMPEGFVLAVHTQAAATVNDQPVRRAVLRNGDLIGIGAVKIRFWLSETRQ